MKRWIGSFALACVAGAAFAQAPFTIVRPADESRVREKVRILIPKGSIPAGGYVGFFLDGSLLEATVPPVEGKYHVYILDTKGRGIGDGKHNVEAVLYVDYKEQPRIVDRSSIDINIANVSNIAVPNRGLTLRYNYRTGYEWVYNLQQRTTVYTISQAQSDIGGRAAELPVDVEKFRMVYAVDGVFPNGDGLIRMQARPMAGKEFADITATGSTEPQRYFAQDMAPIYMRLRPNGQQVYAAIPPYVPFEGSGGGGSTTDLYAAFPLPTLPTKAVRPGDSWPARFQNGNIDLNQLHNLTSVVETFPARGEFVGVEWERGHPCAKIRNTISVGAKSEESRKLASKPADGESAAPADDEKVTLNETIWFALDTRQVLKVIRDMTVETKQQTGFGGFGGGTPGGPPSGMGGPGMPPSMGGGGRMGGPRTPGTMGRQMPPGIGMPPGAQGGGRMGGPQGPGMPPGGFPGFGGMGRGQGTGTGMGSQAQLTKVRIQLVFTLE